MVGLSGQAWDGEVVYISGEIYLTSGQWSFDGPHLVVLDQPSGLARVRWKQDLPSRFPDDVNEKAWDLLKEGFATDEVWAAFNEGLAVEFVNRAGTHRLMLSRDGEFVVLKGKPGKGFTVASGRVREQQFPIGDELTTFVTWFTDRTEELLERWRCGNFSIQPERVAETVPGVVDPRPIGEAVYNCGLTVSVGQDPVAQANAVLRQHQRKYPDLEVKTESEPSRARRLFRWMRRNGL